MPDSNVLDSTSVPLTGHDLGLGCVSRDARAAFAPQPWPRPPWRPRAVHLLLAVALVACSDRRVRFCDPALAPPRGCPVAGAGGASAGGTGGNSAIGGSSGAAGIGGAGGVGGTGGSGGSAGAPATGGTGGVSEVADASVPLLDAGTDAGAVDAAVP